MLTRAGQRPRPQPWWDRRCAQWFFAWASRRALSVHRVAAWPPRRRRAPAVVVAGAAVVALLWSALHWASNASRAALALLAAAVVVATGAAVVVATGAAVVGAAPGRTTTFCFVIFPAASNMNVSVASSTPEVGHFQTRKTWFSSWPPLVPSTWMTGAPRPLRSESAAKRPVNSSLIASRPLKVSILPPIVNTLTSLVSV